MNRRTFSKALAMAIASGAVGAPAVWGAAPRRLKIGCTGLIFRATPGTPENLDDALKHMSSLGFHCFETWGSVLANLEEKSALGPMIERSGIPLRSAFMGVNVHDPSMLKASIDQVIGWGKVTRKYGGTFAVVNAGGVKREAFNFKDVRAHIISGLNDHGKALNDLGLGAGLHQHTGSAVDTRDEVYAVMEAVDTRHMKFAPDVGQLQKAGADAAAVVKDFRTIIVHMHLKDYSGGQHFAGYCPLGQGKVDLETILATMEEANPQANVMVELDGSANQPYTPRETAEISKAYLQKLGYEFRT
jgi:inosose dehydratase